MQSVDSILVLVNPASANNSGHDIWGHLIPRFKALFSSYTHKIVETQSREQNIELGAETDADLIISVGGDGTAHDIAQGLIRRPRNERPALTVVPIGSGNDFAKTLGVPANPRRALEVLSEGKRESIDVGCCNGAIFLETLSFGVDAAIAHKTVEMRKRVNSRGILLYARAAISAIIHELKAHDFIITTEDSIKLEKKLLICAVQNGQTYGGGFRITPHAHINDGLLSICTALDASKLYALYALALLSRGAHEHLSIMETSTARRLTIDLAHNIPAQYDGEFLEGTHFEIELLPHAIDVILPRATIL